MSENNKSVNGAVITAIREFLRLESASGILLIIATVLAMLAQNSPLSHWYDALLGTEVELRVGAFQLQKPLLLWINDGLMALFFFVVGLELKREVLEGEMSRPSQLVLPTLAAIGGMAMPALIYSYINWGDSMAMEGWAIPSATDIAFTLGVLSLLGNRVPSALKLFLLTLAIIDDLGAIIIIAVFYSTNLSMLSLSVASAALVVLFFLNRRGVVGIAPYLLVGSVLWVAVLKSGVHATLAGVILAMFIPIRDPATGESPLRHLEHDLHPAVAYVILPLFAFANTGISLHGLTLDALFAPIPLGIAAGLFLGNQLGIFSVCWLAIKLGLAELPNGVSWLQLYGVSVLCGIGFTMSLFISSLAFEQVGMDLVLNDRLGILLGSALSAVSGYFILRFASSPKQA
ncbi:MAG: Na+/H+ antiporter NhaA [Candidatus Thiodiazotropha sp.]